MTHFTFSMRQFTSLIYTFDPSINLPVGAIDPSIDAVSLPAKIHYFRQLSSHPCPRMPCRRSRVKQDLATFLSSLDFDNWVQHDTSFGHD
jgi:hypothetical protein